MYRILLISALTVLAFIASILFFPQIPIAKGRRMKIYPLIPLTGALCLLLTGDVQWGLIMDSFTEDSSVNPIRILVLFFSMTIFSLLLEQSGFFVHISGVILRRAGQSQYKIFFSLYAVISLLTVFTSNDIVILTFTPFICYFCRAAKIDPIPYLIMEFVAANTWSLFLLIGNPTNIYISGAFDISFFEYVSVMALPTIAAGLTSLATMFLLFRKKLRGEIRNDIDVEPVRDRVLMWVSLVHLVACVLLLSVAQYIGFEMWLISLALALSAVICSTICLVIRRRRVECVGMAIIHMPFENIPFIVGMFVIVLALEGSGITATVAALFQSDESVFSYGFFSFLFCNVLNNIPMSVLFSKILSLGGTDGQIFATVIGSNIGAFLTPVGALAGIMWLNLLKKNKVTLSARRFVLFGGLIGIPALCASLAVLELIF